MRPFINPSKENALRKISLVIVALAAVVSVFAGSLTESPRELPIEKEVDVLVLGGGSAALSAAVAAAKEGASVFLAAPRPYVGDDVAGTLRIFEGRKLVPISHKRACDEALKAAGVAYMTGLFPSEVLVGDDGALGDRALPSRHGAVAGAVLVSKSGRAAVRAGHVLDCTDHAAFARAAGVPFQPFAGGRLAFERTVVTKDEPKADGMTVVERRERPLKSGKVYVCRFEHEMKDLSYASFAEAEQRARDLTWTPSELDAADRLRFVPPVCATGKLDHLTLVGAWAEKDPAKREAALDPAVAEKLGEAAGRAAAKDARARRRKGKVRVAVHAPHGRARSPSAPHGRARSPSAPDEGAEAADTKEFLWGFRPFDRGLAKVGASVHALPVLGEYDVVVVGGGTSGGPATIASARAGAKTLLLEYQYALGGVSTIGMIGKYWYGNKCGFTAELERGVKAMGEGVYVNAKAEWMRREARKGGAEMWFGVMGCGAVVRNGRVAGVVVATPCGRGVVLAKDVIDATGNSDIAAAAGAETEFISDEEIVIQDAGTPVRDLGSRYANSDWGFVNDGDAYDVWLFEMRGRRGVKTYWDMPGVVGSRERRRIKSAYAPTVVDMVSRRTFPDTVVCAQSNFDSHGPTDDPFCMFKCFMGRTTMHINVPYRVMIPEKLDGVVVTGLGVGAKHDALPIMRMQADLHNLGYVAGLAAAQAASRGCELRGVDVHDLQLELVKEKIIPSAVLAWKDSLPDDAAFAAAVKACADEGYPSLDTVLLRQRDEALSALRAAYAAEGDAKRRLRYAAILGIYRDPTGADALVDFFAGKGPEIVFPVRKRRNGSPADPRGRRLGGREMMLIALGRTRDPRAVPVIAAEAEKISADCWIGLTRTVSLAAEGLANPKLAPALEAALRRPGVMGHAVKSIDELAPGGGNKILPEVYEGLCELNLARALLACGDPNGLARSIFESYAADPRGVWALHARKVLAKTDQKTRRNENE